MRSRKKERKKEKKKRNVILRWRVEKQNSNIEEFYFLYSVPAQMWLATSKVNSLRSLATASFPSIRKLTVARKVLLSYKHRVTQFFFVYFFSGIHLMSFSLWAIRWSVTVKGTGKMSTNTWRLLHLLFQPLLIFLQEEFISSFHIRSCSIIY